MLNGELTLAIVQMQMHEEQGANDAAAESGIREAAANGAELVCLPELYRSRYFCQTEDESAFALAEPVPGGTTERLGELARELEIGIVASLFERRAAGIYHNTAAVLDAADGYLGKYRKMHIPDDPGYGEKYYFTPGDLGFKRFDTAAGPVGVLICWDQWYPEAARLTALRGAEVLFYPTAIGWHPEERDTAGPAQAEAWKLMQRSHAIANGCFVAAANRVGFEPRTGGDSAGTGSDPARTGGTRGIQFWGQSFIAGPDGQMIAEASAETPEVLIATIDRGAIEQARIAWPFLRDRRLDAYQPLTLRWDD